MTKQEMNNKISELEKQIVELKEQLEKKHDRKIWKPKPKEKYYCIDYTYDNCIKQYTNELDEIDNGLIESGNCYFTKEKAEFEAQREKYTRLFRQYIEQYSEPLDWNNKLQDKWGIYYGHKSNIIGFTCVTTCKELFQIYASSTQVLKEAIDFVGEENVKKYILEIKE